MKTLGHKVFQRDYPLHSKRPNCFRIRKIGKSNCFMTGNTSAKFLRRTLPPNLPKLAALVLGLFLSGCKSAAPVPEANETAARPRAVNTDRQLPMLFIVGDSTVHNGAPGLVG